MGDINKFSIFAAFGVKVTLIETNKQILGREDELLSQTMHDAFRAGGIEIEPEVDSLAKGLLLAGRLDDSERARRVQDLQRHVSGTYSAEATALRWEAVLTGYLPADSSV